MNTLIPEGANRALFDISTRSTRVDFFNGANFISTITGNNVDYCLNYCRMYWQKVDYGVYRKKTESE
jgi:hypothetical protein